MEVSGLIINDVLVDVFYYCYEKDVWFFLVYIFVDFFVGEFCSYEVLFVIIFDFLIRFFG